MMCAQGFPGYMIHGPPSSGFAVSPLVCGAESDRINAIYDYHKAFAALESAVGHPLR